MKLALFYDTETTGLPLFKEPSEDPRQPHLVQLAAELVDLDAREVLSSIDLTIRPDGWKIPDDVAAIHGIDNKLASIIGISERMAVGIFMEFWASAGTVIRVAHNEQFDARILRIALARYDSPSADIWKVGKAACTAQMSTPILNLPPTQKMLAAGRRHAKTANLGEAYRHFTGKDLDGAHNALVDVQACRQVYFAIQDYKKEPACSA